MKSLNKVMLIGNLTHDPEVRTTPKGVAVTDFSLALNRSFPADNGDRREETTFVDVVAWSKSAEFVGQYFQKGKKAYVEGRLQLDSWEDKDTRQPRHKPRVVAERVEFADSRPADSEGEPDGSQSNFASGPPRKDQRARQHQQHSQSQQTKSRQYERSR